MRSCAQCLSPYTQDVEFCGIDGSRLIETEADPLVGNDVDRYRILQHIGDGGMARVYRARHHTLDREVAVKVLFGEFASNKTVAERFRREAQTISRIEHVNIVGVTDFGRTAQGLTFLAMELVRGRTIRRLVKTNGALEPAFVARTVRQIALGLEAAHAQGFVHRDLKPGNVMVVGDAPDEVVKILDFGLARMADEDNELYLTRTGQFLGTPIYMAPEQIVGADVDLRADLYSLGVMMFEMLEGHPPFTANKLAAIREKHLSELPAAVRPSGGLEHIVARLLEKDANDRFGSAGAVVAELDGLTGDPQPTEVQVTPVDIGATQRMPFPQDAAGDAIVVAPSLGAAEVAEAQDGPTEVAAHEASPTKEIVHTHERDTDERPSAVASDELGSEAAADEWEDGPTVAASADAMAQAVPQAVAQVVPQAAPSAVTTSVPTPGDRARRKSWWAAAVTAVVAVVAGLVLARWINPPTRRGGGAGVAGVAARAGASGPERTAAAGSGSESDADSESESESDAESESESASESESESESASESESESESESASASDASSRFAFGGPRTSASGSGSGAASTARSTADSGPPSGTDSNVRTASGASAPDAPPRRRAARRRRLRTKASQKRLRRRAAARVDEALGARGLVRGDLAKSNVTAQAYARWRAARSQDDAEAWARTTDAVVEGVRAYPITKAVVDRRLQRVARRLEAAAAVVRPEALRPLEDRYLAVAAEVQPGMSEAAAQRALERATALLAAVNRALPR